MIIHKQILPLYAPGKEFIALPYPSVYSAIKNILYVDAQRNTPCIWYRADSEYDNQDFVVISLGTGHVLDVPLIDSNRHIGSVILDSGSLVFHYFLMDKKEYDQVCEMNSELRDL